MLPPDYLRQYLPTRPYNRERVGYAMTPILIAVVLLIIDRYGIQPAFYREFAYRSLYTGMSTDDLAFWAQVHFTGACLLLLVVVPVIFNALLPYPSSDPFGFRVKRSISHWPAYGMVLATMIPVLWWISRSATFQDFYPMFKPQRLGDWVIYECIYMVQFFTVEFFFRGFALFRLERVLGMYAIAVMAVPYALFHIHKPLPEALASIGAALILGVLALKGRSIWPGVVVHCGVAFSMDLFALIRSGRITAMVP